MNIKYTEHFIKRYKQRVGKKLKKKQRKVLANIILNSKPVYEGYDRSIYKVKVSNYLFRIVYSHTTDTFITILDYK
jgi:hypothetical protein